MAAVEDKGTGGDAALLVRQTKKPPIGLLTMTLLMPRHLHLLRRNLARRLARLE